jgi:eukaryotic-like serine/threonine-protein kinase
VTGGPRRAALLALAGLLAAGCERVAGIDDLFPPDGQAADQDPADAGTVDAAPACEPGDGGPASCPAAMALVAPPGVCVDRYEAARGAGDVAIAEPGLQPWTEITFDEAGAACARAGKRLCAEGEWAAACQGPCGRAYPYGDAYRLGACNDRDGTAGRGLQSTGAYAACAGGLGVFDLVGNASEWIVPDGLPAAVAGGAYDDGDAAAACASAAELPATTSDARVGFRCCLTP